MRLADDGVCGRPLEPSQVAITAVHCQTPCHRVAVLAHDASLAHHTGWDHPEAPARYEAVTSTLRQADYAERLRWIEPAPLEPATLELCHERAYIELVRREIEAGATELSTGDTQVGPKSLDAALHACGASVAAVDELFQGPLRRAFCVVRPPGHHASSGRGMGFCIFNNVALAARYAQQTHGVERVVIVDWDVHHGNGTQDIFYDDDSVLVFNTHQYPWYPGTGAAGERGGRGAEGLNINCPLPAGSGRGEVFEAFERHLLPAVEQFRPELVLVSAGFDSRRGDPLGRMTLDDRDFADLTRLLVDVARRWSAGRLLALLEGGYHLRGLCRAVDAHVRALCAEP